MLLILALLASVFNLIVAASHSNGLEGVPKQLLSRQIIEAGSSVACCTSCTETYSYNTFWDVFNDFCTWAGGGLELYTDMTYATNNYYCKSGADVCIHLQVQYLGTTASGGGNTATVDYNGCMGYFLMAVTPASVCGGPPYPGARIVSADGAWIFQATADNSADFNDRFTLDCDQAGRVCHLPGSKTAANTGPRYTFD